MKKYVFIIAGMVCLASCKKEVALNLGDAGPHLVIQGDVTDAAGPYTVRVTRSVGFYEGNVFPGVSGSVIHLTDNEGNTDSLVETTPGIYITQSIQGKPGNTYTLTVKVQDSLFTAVSTMPSAVPFDSVTFRKNGAFGNDQIIAVPHFQDPAGERNFYLFNEYRNGILLTKDIFVFDDRLSDGRYVERGLRNSDDLLKMGDSVEVRMYCIDEPVFNYFNQLDASGGGGGGFGSSASPTNPVSNISNGALGYLSAHTIRSRKAKVHIE